MLNSSIVSCEVVDSGEEPPPLTSITQLPTQEIKDIFVDKQPIEIAAEITELPIGWQVAAFYKLPRTQAIAVYQSLDTSTQKQIQEDFKKRNDLDLTDELSSQERLQLFELIYIPHAHQDVEAAVIKDNEYTAKSPLEIVKQRLGWLFILLIASSGTTAVIKSQEHILQQVVVLASFIPLLIAYGGNVSTQTATVVVRALHTQKFKLQVLLQRVLYQEMTSGILLGAILGILVAGEALLLQNNPMVALVTGLSLFLISVLASFCGSMLPFLFQVLGFDPALMSAPLGATLVDVAGILIYLYVARLILHI
jgi:magnesium transporter